MNAPLRIYSDRHLNDFSLYHHFRVIVVFHTLETKRLLNARQKLRNSYFPDSAYTRLLNATAGILSPSLLEILKVLAKSGHHIVFRKIVSVKLFKCNKHKKVKYKVTAQDVETNEV
jgi:hypothetical protein